MTAPVVEAAGPGDMEAIVALSAATYREHQDRLPEAFPPGTGNALEAQYRAHFDANPTSELRAREGIIVARKDGRLVGHVFYRLRTFDRHPDHHDIVGTVLDISIQPAYRRRGLGGALIASAEATMRTMGATRIDAHVWDGNTASAAAFSATGFRPLYTHYYRRVAAPLPGSGGPAAPGWRSWFLRASILANIILLGALLAGALH